MELILCRIKLYYYRYCHYNINYMPFYKQFEILVKTQKLTW